jgi:hypothetical protein
MWEVGLPPLLWCFPPTTAFTSFPSPDCWACAAAPAVHRVCLQLTWEVGLPPSPVKFSSLHHSHKLSRSWLLGAHPRSHWSLSGQAQLVYLEFQEGFPSPPLQCSVCPTLFAMCVYCSYCLLLSFSYFPGGGQSVQGVMLFLAQGCLWKYRILLSSPCPRLPKPSGRRQLAARGPSWFLHLTWNGDSLCRLEEWRGQSFASSWWFCLQGVCPAFFQGFTIGGTLCASSLSLPSWNSLSVKVLILLSALLSPSVAPESHQGFLFM